MGFSTRFIEGALGFTPRPAGNTEFAEPEPAFPAVVTDSRKISPGCLFVALKGEKFDGHDFIAGAIAQGARGLVCRRGFESGIAPAVRVYPVDDTEIAFRKLGAAWRREFSIPVIGIAGSVGKTTTKELLAALLRGRWPEVLKTAGSQNGFVGIPMTLLELRSKHGAAVIEIGIDEIGAMEQHMAAVRPGFSVLTAIGPEHLEKLSDVATVAREEGIALSAVARAGGTVALNLDDSWIRPFVVSIREGRKICYSLDGATLPDKASGVTELEVLRGSLSEDGTTLKVTGGGLGVSLSLPLLGKHNARNLLGAVAVARALGLSSEELAAGLKTFGGTHGRSELRTLPGDTPVLCDYYNANPTSVEAGLDLLAQLAARDGKKRARWACLADMLELGAEEEQFHRELARTLIAQGVENVLLHGPRMRWLLEELVTRGFRGRAQHYDSHAQLAGALIAGMSAGDTLLIKGSRGMRMEEVWKIFENHARGQWKDG